MRHTIPLMTALSAAVMIGLSACGQSGQTGQADPDPTSSSQISVEALSLGSAWVKAADEGMTSVFGEVRNTTDAEITLVGARYGGAEDVELHETVDDGTGAMSMQEKDGGFTIPAGGTLTFEPGGNHIMLMGLTEAIAPGERIELDLITADDRTIPVSAVAKEYSGAQEDYAPGAEGDDGH